MKTYVRSLVAGIFLTFSAIAVGEGILSDEDGKAAEPEALLAEVAVFKGIREGLTLTFALCDIDLGCDPAASDSEVKQLLTALDQRIDGLTQRQQDSEESEGLDDVLLAYFDEREGFSQILEKLGDSSEAGSSVVGGDIEESDLFGEDESEAEATAETDSVEQFNDMFADEDEEL
jgi:hypothetical protein